MSNSLITEVYSRQLGSMARKAVLALFADKANDDGTGIYEGTGAAQEEARVVASGTNNRIEARRPRPITVAKLTANFPPANVGAGARHFVSDANSTTFNAVVAGGGSNIVPVRCDGTNWRIG